ncbi:hypothetical protein [Nostoc sp. DedQUE09]|uniref:hypothetical protein n=1 Tax=Nostoc sp. DedQUE09 TaxID=3075394 RepID=UPI002AD3D012|nr:hypothetical protein [Nostoc sp. DedQUE09]MDZ7949890.1 hypothetical protein [Nostoc sp. DedQUE09]
MEEVAIALMQGSPSPKSNRLSRVIAESPADMGYWSDGVLVENLVLCFLIYL